MTTFLPHLRRFGLVMLVGAVAILQFSRASVTIADVPPTATPVPVINSASPAKNGTAETSVDVASGTFAATSPESGSKNNAGVTTNDDALQGAPLVMRPRLSVTHSANAQAVPAPGVTATDLAASGALITCGASGSTNWTTTSGDFQVIRQCRLSVPQNGWVFISANGSLGRQNGEYEAQFRIDIDSTSGDADIDRWVNVYDDSGDGTDESIALSVLEPVTTGVHTFYFLGTRTAGAGTVLVYDPTLTVIFIPATNSDILTCGASGNLNWTTTSSSLSDIRQCALTVPQDGWVFISADGSLARFDGEYEAQFRIGIDSTGGDADIDRWVNVYDDSGDGTDRSVALSVLKPVTSGAHTFHFLGGRSTGSSTVLLYDPTLTVIYIPSPGAADVTCGASGNTNWTTTSGSFAVIRQCTFSAPKDGWVFISADGSLGRQDGEYEAKFRIGIGSTSGDDNIDRWVNVYDDSGDGTDKSVALSVLKPISAGAHTFYFLGSREAGAGTVLVYDPTLTVVFLPGERVFLPLVIRGQ